MIHHTSTQFDLLRDPAFRALARKDPKTAAKELGYPDELLNQPDIAWVIKHNTKHKFYVTFHDAALKDEVMSNIHAGGAGCNGTISSASCTIPSCVLSVASMGTISSVSTAGADK